MRRIKFVSLTTGKEAVRTHSADISYQKSDKLSTRSYLVASSPAAIIAHMRELGFVKKNSKEGQAAIKKFKKQATEEK